MNVWVVVGFIAVTALLALGLAYAGVRAMSRREPYRSFLKLPIRSKLAFFRRLVKDRRVPWWVKAAPFALVLYLALPFDLAPDFIPVLGYLDDVGAGAAHLGLCDALHPSGRSAGADEGSGHSPGVGEVETKPKP